MYDTSLTTNAFLLYDLENIIQKYPYHETEQVVVHLTVL